MLPGTSENTSELTGASRRAAYTVAEDDALCADSVMDAEKYFSTVRAGSSNVAACSVGVSVICEANGTYLVTKPFVPTITTSVLPAASAVSCTAFPVPLPNIMTAGDIAGGQAHTRGIRQQLPHIPRAL